MLTYVHITRWNIMKHFTIKEPLLTNSVSNIFHATVQLHPWHTVWKKIANKKFTIQIHCKIYCLSNTYKLQNNTTIQKYIWGFCHNTDCEQILGTNKIISIRKLSEGLTTLGTKDKGKFGMQSLKFTIGTWASLYNL